MSHPFEVVGEMTMKLGDPEPAFPSEARTVTPYPTGEVRIGARSIGDWADEDETPLMAIARLNTEVIDKEAERRRAVDLLEAANGTVEQRDSMLADTRRELARTRRELDEFKATVREVAIRVAGEQGWCDLGLNAVLDELGLPQKVTRFKVPITVTASQQVWVEVDADDEDDAIDQVERSDVRNAIDPDDWDIDDWEKTEYQSVQPADDY